MAVNPALSTVRASPPFPPLPLSRLILMRCRCNGVCACVHGQERIKFRRSCLSLFLSFHPFTGDPFELLAELKEREMEEAKMETEKRGEGLGNQGEKETRMDGREVSSQCATSGSLQQLKAKEGAI